jgi:hypothetical protein
VKPIALPAAAVAAVLLLGGCTATAPPARTAPSPAAHPAAATPLSPPALPRVLGTASGVGPVSVRLRAATADSSVRVLCLGSGRLEVRVGPTLSYFGCRPGAPLDSSRRLTSDSGGGRQLQVVPHPAAATGRLSWAVTAGRP